MEEINEIVEKEEKQETAIIEHGIIHSIDDMNSIASIMYQSGLFDDIKSTAQAFVKIMAGQELGIGAFASMRNIYIINGQTTLSAGLMASKIKAHPKYDYRIKHLDKQGCIISFYEIKNDKPEHLGDSSFDESDAQDAGLLYKSNWKSYKRNMYFSRALSNGVRFYCPDIFYGTSVYTPEEINPDWVIDESFIISENELNKKSDSENKPDQKPIGNKRPYDPIELKAQIQKFEKIYNKNWDAETLEKKRTSVVINLETCYAGNGADMKRHEAMLYLVGVAHKNELTAPQTYALLRWLAPSQDSGGAWAPDPMAVREAQTLLTYARKENGQEELLEGETE